MSLNSCDRSRSKVGVDLNIPLEKTGIVRNVNKVQKRFSNLKGLKTRDSGSLPIRPRTFEA